MPIAKPDEYQACSTKGSIPLLLWTLVWVGTFILVDKGEEVDRLIGYPGDEHFWFLLGDMLEKL